MPKLTKRCTKCKQVKSISEFHKRTSAKDGLCPGCKSCGKEQCRGYLLKNRIKLNKQQNARYHKRYQSDAEYRKARRLRGRASRFGMSVDDYVEMYDSLIKKQNGCCAICGRHQAGLGKAFDVDHCHKTMKIRGLLCNACNTALGSMGDEPVRLRRAADYIEEF
ncbi:hypothetical protein LCGC14_1939530 [marine sediment metagenome]|uniref:Recombination endonuclease VII n=1 Tax=marine sediment metagenome TaxID=412755 RepID=A0A0F9FL04_9ZZZZ